MGVVFLPDMFALNFEKVICFGVDFVDGRNLVEEVCET